ALLPLGLGGNGSKGHAVMLHHKPNVRRSGIITLGESTTD
ncbi:MAG: hypothetical protein QOH94_1699, partial [Mycobacterium sp.]|nr:hypothetical protein [Mycobacterium sp.]